MSTTNEVLPKYIKNVDSGKEKYLRVRVPVIKDNKWCEFNKQAYYGNRRTYEEALKIVKAAYLKFMRSAERKRWEETSKKPKAFKNTRYRSNDYVYSEREKTLPFRSFGIIDRLGKLYLTISCKDPIGPVAFISKSLNKYGVEECVRQLNDLRKKEFGYPKLPEEDINFLIKAVNEQIRHFNRHGEVNKTLGNRYIKKHPKCIKLRKK